VGRGAVGVGVIHCRTGRGLRGAKHRFVAGVVHLIVDSDVDDAQLTALAGVVSRHGWECRTTRGSRAPDMGDPVDVEITVTEYENGSGMNALAARVEANGLRSDLISGQGYNAHSALEYVLSKLEAERFTLSLQLVVRHAEELAQLVKDALATQGRLWEQLNAANIRIEHLELELAVLGSSATMADRHPGLLRHALGAIAQVCYTAAKSGAESFGTIAGAGLAVKVFGPDVLHLLKGVADASSISAEEISAIADQIASLVPGID
jgi:hypothetical protein